MFGFNSFNGQSLSTREVNGFPAPLLADHSQDLIKKEDLHQNIIDKKPETGSEKIEDGVNNAHMYSGGQAEEEKNHTLDNSNLNEQNQSQKAGDLVDWKALDETGKPLFIQKLREIEQNLSDHSRNNGNTILDDLSTLEENLDKSFESLSSLTLEAFLRLSNIYSRLKKDEKVQKVLEKVKKKLAKLPKEGENEKFHRIYCVIKANNLLDSGDMGKLKEVKALLNECWRVKQKHFSNESTNYLDFCELLKARLYALKGRIEKAHDLRLNAIAVRKKYKALDIDYLDWEAIDNLIPK